MTSIIDLLVGRNHSFMASTARSRDERRGAVAEDGREAYSSGSWCGRQLGCRVYMIWQEDGVEIHEAVCSTRGAERR